MIRMIQPVTFTDLREGHYTVDIDTINTCPMCHHSIEPVYLNSYCCDDSLSVVYVIFLCAHCHKPFLCTYTQINGNMTCTARTPKSFQEMKFSEFISKLSPDFVEIYNQSLQAEEHHLDQICGIGYRKATEFLVKDYLIHLNPEKSDMIKSASLGTCIKLIENPKVKTLAERTTWIGNDETHYVKKHIERDVSDIKLFLSALVASIECDLIFEEALSISKK